MRRRKAVKPARGRHGLDQSWAATEGQTLSHGGGDLTDSTIGVAPVFSPLFRAGALEFEPFTAPPLFLQKASGRGQLLSPLPSVILTLGLGWETSEFP